jgi:glycosyltransferase involved in cell wall biosynthesis
MSYCVEGEDVPEAMVGRLDHEPEVSVVVPTKNRDVLLRQTLSTISWQQDVAFEAIVVDDGSADPGQVERIVADIGDPRLRIVRHDRSQGVSEARNRGSVEAKAPWVAFCDDDDLWARNKLAKQLEAARRVPAARWVYVGSVNITPGNRVVGGEPPPTPDEVAEHLEERNVIPGGSSGVMARRAALLDVGGFDPSLQPLADWDLWLRMLRVSPPAGVAEPLVAYRVHALNMSLDTRRVEADFAVLAGRYPRANAAILYRYLGWWSIRVGRHTEATRYLLRAAAARDPRYPPRLVMQDLLYLARDAAAHARARLFPPLKRPARQDRVTVQQADWRKRAQRWVDELAAT